MEVKREVILIQTFNNTWKIYLVDCKSYMIGLYNEVEEKTIEALQSVIERNNLEVIEISSISSRGN